VRSLLVAGAALAALACAVASAAHGPARPAGYVSTVLAVSPDVLGLTATVLGGDDKLSVRNEGVLGWVAQPASDPDDGGAPAWLVPAAVAGGLLAAAALALPVLVQRRRRAR
jgi:hypothetical protein